MVMPCEVLHLTLLISSVLEPAVAVSAGTTVGVGEPVKSTS